MRIPVILAALVVSGCAQTHAAPPLAGASGSCPIIESSDWTAFVNAMPGPGARPTLIVTGKVTVPTGGYQFDWYSPDVAESSPVQVRVRLRPIAPHGMATQALVTHDVHGQWPSEPRVGAVTVDCGGRTLARISPVVTAR